MDGQENGYHVTDLQTVSKIEEIWISQKNENSTEQDFIFNKVQNSLRQEKFGPAPGLDRTSTSLQTQLFWRQRQAASLLS